MNDEVTESRPFEPTMLYHAGHLPGHERLTNKALPKISCKVVHSQEDHDSALKDGWVEDFTTIEGEPASSASAEAAAKAAQEVADKEKAEAEAAQAAADAAAEAAKAPAKKGK